MRGGVRLFRCSAAEARRYVDAKYARGIKACRGATECRTEYVEFDGTGAVTARRVLSADEYQWWVDWVNPITKEDMGTPRRRGQTRSGSPRFADISVTVPYAWSVAAAADPRFAAVLNEAQADAASQISRWVAQHSVTLIGSRGAQELRPVEGLQIVTFSHDVNRLGGPYRHTHIQIGARVWAVGKWRALAHTALLFKHQARIREIGSAALDMHRLQPPATSICGAGPAASTFTSERNGRHARKNL